MTLHDAPPASAVFIILPGATATAATVAMQMPNGKPITLGTVNAVEGTFMPTTESFVAWWKTLPTTPPDKPDQPWNNGGSLAVS